MSRIAMYNLADTKRDPRVRRIATALATLGHEVRVFELNPGREPGVEQIEKFTVSRCTAPGRTRLKEMREIEDASPAAAAILDSLDRDVMRHRAGRVRMTIARGRRAIGRRLGKLRGNNPAEFEDLRGGDRLLELRNLRLMMLNSLSLYRGAMAFEPDIVHANDLNTLLAGFMVKQARNIPLVYDAHEIYAEQFPADQRSDRWHAFYTGLERQLIAHTDARLTVCDSIGTHFQETYGSGPVFTVRNMPSVKYLPPRTILDRKVTSAQFLYHGLFFAYRGLEEVIDAAKHLREGRIFLRGLGYHEAALKQRAAEANVGEKLVFLPPVKVDELVETATGFDVGLNPFVAACKNTEICLPNKFFEYTMAGLAAACTDLPELRAHVRRYELGTLFAPGSPEAMAAGLNDLASDKARLQQHRENAYNSAYRELNWETERAKVADVYRSFM